jgi:environmental stress-induced protein Ves
MQIIRKSAFSSARWKNGGGITHEVMRVPPGGGPFRWRVSVAQVDASGPFSDFAGYRRFMVLLEGGGVRLAHARGNIELRAVGDLAEFDGGSAIHGELIAGPCTDLNFIVSTSATGVRAWVETVRGPHVPEQRGGALLLFAVRGGFAVETGDGASLTLGAWDFALASAQERVTLTPAAGAPLVFLATLDDNSL